MEVGAGGRSRLEVKQPGASNHPRKCQASDRGGGFDYKIVSIAIEMIITSENCKKGPRRHLVILHLTLLTIYF